MKTKLMRVTVLFLTMAVFFSGCGGGKDSAADKGSHTKNRQTTVNDILNDKTSGDEDSQKPSQEQGESKDEEPDASDDKSDEGKDVKTAAASGNNGGGAVKISSEAEASAEEPHADAGGDAIDIDLTALSATMVYSEVFSMMAVPHEYVGKRIKMEGLFAYYQDTETNKEYFACIIQDATACCAQGIEFELEGKHKYPRDYPKLDENFCIQGIFEEYEEKGLKFYRLAHAEFVK